MAQNNVTDLSQPLHRHHLNAELLCHFLGKIRIISHQLHAKTLGHHRRLAGNAAAADESHGHAINPVELGRVRKIPLLLLADLFVISRDVAQCGENQCHGVLCHLVKAVIRYIGHCNPQFLGRIQVNVIHAHGGVCNDLQIRQLLQNAAGERRVLRQRGHRSLAGLNDLFLCQNLGADHLRILGQVLLFHVIAAPAAVCNDYFHLVSFLPHGCPYRTTAQGAVVPQPLFSS